MEQVREEFMQSQEYAPGLSDHLEVMQLGKEDIEIKQETIVLNDQEYPVLVAVPDTSKLNETQQKYEEFYDPVPIAIYAEKRQTGEREWMVEPPLRLFAEEIGLKIRNNSYWVDRRDSDTGKNKLKHFNGLIENWALVWNN